MHFSSKKIIIPVICILGILVYHRPAIELVKLSLDKALYSHILLVPLVSIYLIWVNRRAIFSEVNTSSVLGLSCLVLSIFFAIMPAFIVEPAVRIDALFFSIAGMLMWIYGGFILTCGWRCFQRALFPMLFMAFMLPIPTLILDPTVRFLQLGSTEATEGLLRILNVPFYREGVFISLPGVTVEVAKECSGIRSTVALLVLCSVASFLFLRSNIRRWLLMLLLVPVTIIKNGMRITTLVLLGSYVDMAYISDSTLHSAGGKPFFVVAVLMMSPFLWALRRSEAKSDTDKKHGEASQTTLVGTTEITKDTHATS